MLCIKLFIIIELYIELEAEVNSLLVPPKIPPPPGLIVNGNSSKNILM
jgi:hypothetical protein